MRTGGRAPQDEPHGEPRGKPKGWNEASFSATLSAARAGDSAALAKIHRECSPAVAGYLRSQGVADVGGTTNDVFLRVFTRLVTFAGDEVCFRSWMFTIAHHLMIDELRRKARRPKITDGASVETKEQRGDAEEEALAGLGRERVDRMLARLSIDQRAVVLLRVVEDLPIDQVAEILGKRPTAVKALQHRALAALRRHLVDEEVSP